MGHLLFSAAKVARLYTVKYCFLMPRSSANQAKVSSFDALLDAGVASIANKGIDRVTVADVIAISGHSRPTFYSYFGDVNGLLAEIWIKHGRARLDAEITAVAGSGERTGSEVGIDQTLLQIMCVAHRIPEVAEVVLPDIREWWAELTKGNRYIELRTAWILAVQIGIAMSVHVDPENRQAATVLPLLKQMPDNMDGSLLLLGLDEMPGFPEAEPVLEKPESVDEQIMRATIEIIANSGVDAASVARIARKCRVSTGTIYPRFGTAEDLLEKAFEASIRDVVSGNLRQAGTTGLGFDQYGLTVASGFGENRRIWRDYRLEMHLAALHNPKLCELMKPGFEVSRNMLVDSIKSVPILGKRVAEPLSYLMQVLALGLSIMHNLGLPLKTMDHRIVVRHLGASFALPK
jgi:AcrR family transcriptional regulator